jgi:hypothetical protein
VAVPETAQFEEKEYETAANIELSCGPGTVFSPGQVAEKRLGYDAAVELPPGAAADIVYHLIGARPRGVRLTPSFWRGCDQVPTADDLPGRYVSLLLQYKRPEYVTEAGARQRSHWKRAYFRWRVRKPQHAKLRRLEQQLGPLAAVRYAAPAFITKTELETSQVRRDVLRATNFVSPERVGKHHVWTYLAPGGYGYANAPGEIVDAESFDDLLRNAAAGIKQVTLQQHVDSLSAVALTKAEYRLVAKRTTWTAEYGLDDQTLLFVARIAALGRRFAERRLSWWILRT